MPKMKTNKAAARRFKITGTGKVLRRQAGKRHLNEWMKASKKRSLRGTAEVHPDVVEHVLEMFPYRKYVR